MPCQIVWQSDAVRDLARLRRFIYSENQTAAERAIRRIKKGIALLAENPEAGKPALEVFPFRDLVLPHGAGSYILRYRLDGEVVVIVRIRHSKEGNYSRHHD
ncbi:MAG: hypothetical protein DHS20C11_31250 [Lysobacteraceae bacterium]|nr:MAG: hypothetical protein DHS20C11_31250 [Xanthomonadaceae bacterium]